MDTTIDNYYIGITINVKMNKIYKITYRNKNSKELHQCFIAFFFQETLLSNDFSETLYFEHFFVDYDVRILQM